MDDLTAPVIVGGALLLLAGILLAARVRRRRARVRQAEVQRLRQRADAVARGDADAVRRADGLEHLRTWAEMGISYDPKPAQAGQPRRPLPPRNWVDPAGPVTWDGSSHGASDPGHASNGGSTGDCGRSN